MIDEEKELADLGLSVEVLTRIRNLLWRAHGEGVKQAIRRYAPDCAAVDLASVIAFADTATKPRAVILAHGPWQRVLEELHSLPPEEHESISFPMPGDTDGFRMLNIKGVPVHLDAGL